MSGAGGLFRNPEFSTRDPDAKRLYELFITAYPKKQLILDLLNETQIRESDVSTDGAVRQVWLAVLQFAAPAGLLKNLIETVLRDPTRGAFHADFRKFLDAEAAAAEDTTRDGQTLLSEVDTLLAGAGRSRAPIIIAVETDDAKLKEPELARSACHLTVTLPATLVRELETTARTALDGAGSVAELVQAGQLVWEKLTQHERRLLTLEARIAGKGLSQPVAWCARPALLASLAPVLQIAHTGGRGGKGFLSLGSGAHYLTPVQDALDGDLRTMKHRPKTHKLTVGLVDVRGAGPEQSMAQFWTRGADVLVTVQDEDQAALAEIRTMVLEDVISPTRAVIAFGAGAELPDVDALLKIVPFVACADAAAAPPALEALGAALRRYAETIAMPCVVSAVRAAWAGRALERDDVTVLRRALRWSSWSWLGVPLFSQSYGEVEQPLYPHLMDLRKVASREWYFDRKQRVAKDYQAAELTRTMSPTADRFHLYLSGAGGTGKSCFLHHVYDEIDARPTSIAVWYRVDAPSSSWENIESRVREETVAAVADKVDRETAEAVAQLPDSGLKNFLSDAAALLQSKDESFDEIAVFIDQLERTFESGDEPNPHRLEAISEQLIDLLKRVGVGNGVRVFVASRKQYLPDFLVSYRAARECRLEFNVLQVISDDNERTAFVDKVLTWCREQKLAAPTVRMSPEATKLLVGNLDGNPLNMMLALIHLLSQNFTGVISEDDVKDHEPWNRLFLLDLAAAERDELDWHFLLAMAHARTEIVRFEEVWWRVRMVSARLTRRVDDLRREGVIERMWLLGVLGRTVHARPLGNEEVRFVEFFHANLRDYLLREVMGHGRAAAGVGRRHGGTPSAWRALDRLSVFAHDWAQTLQPLLAEEIRVLMEHKKEVVQAGLVPDEAETPPFCLLFLRDRENARKELSKAAMACFAYSALVHDEQGKWAVETLFPDVQERVAQCADWLRRSPGELRPAVVRYLVTLITLDVPPAKDLVVELLVNTTETLREGMAQAAASVLTEPLSAARFRNDVLLLVLTSALRQVGGDPRQLPAHVSGFVVAACGQDRDTLLSAVTYCVDRLSTSEDASLRALAPGLQAFGIDEWLTSTDVAPLLRGRTLTDGGQEGRALLELALGADLRRTVTDEQLATWSADLRSRLGLPLPALMPIDGDVEADEAELRFYGRRISRTVFRPGLRRVSKRLWELSGGARQPEAVQDVEGGEDVLWLHPQELRNLNYRFPAPGVDQAAVDWLEGCCRRSFVQLYDQELYLPILREAAAGQRLRRIGQQLRPVIVDLVTEGVPLGSRDALLEQLADLAPRIKQTDQLIQRMREYLKAGICRSVADSSRQITTILLAERLEQELADAVDEQGRLALSTAAAIRLDAAIRRQLIRNAEQTAGPPLVLVTIPRVRPPLARLLHRLDHSIPVLSFTELEEDLIPVPGGLVDVVLEPEARP